MSLDFVCFRKERSSVIAVEGRHVRHVDRCKVKEQTVVDVMWSGRQSVVEDGKLSWMECKSSHGTVDEALVAAEWVLMEALWRDIEVKFGCLSSSSLNAHQDQWTIQRTVPCIMLWYTHGFVRLNMVVLGKFGFLFIMLIVLSYRLRQRRRRNRLMNCSMLNQTPRWRVRWSKLLI